MKYQYYIEQAMKGGLEKAQEYSVPLLYTALKVKEHRFEHKQIKLNIKNALMRQQTNEGFNSFNSWLFGRVFYSDKLSGIPLDLEMLYYPSTKEGVSNRLNNSPDKYDLWAASYFAYDKQYYDLNKEKVFNSVKNVQEVPDKLWTHILLLNAAVEHQDKELSIKVKEEACTITNQSKINEAIKMIPYEDYQGWALSLLLIAEAKLSEDRSVAKDIVNDLKEVIQKRQSVHDLALIDAYLFYLKENCILNVSLKVE